MPTYYAPGISGIGTRARARAWHNKKFSPGWCLYWCLTQVFKVPGLGDYDHDGAADAEDYWKAAVKRGTVVHAKDVDKLDNIPAGVLLMWVGGSHDNGHAAYCLGGGRMESTDLPTRGRIGEVDIETPHKVWGHTFVGYVLVDGNGYTLTRPEPTKAPVPIKRRLYKVTATTGLRGRRGPSTALPTVRVAKTGHTVPAVAIATGDGREWAVTKNGVHYALEYLEPV